MLVLILSYLGAALGRRWLATSQRVTLMPVGRTAGLWPAIGRVGVCPEDFSASHVFWVPRDQVENSGRILGQTWGEVCSFSSSAMT